GECGELRHGVAALAVERDRHMSIKSPGARCHIEVLAVECVYYGLECLEHDFGPGIARKAIHQLRGRGFKVITSKCNHLGRGLPGGSSEIASGSESLRAFQLAKHRLVCGEDQVSVFDGRYLPARAEFYKVRFGITGGVFYETAFAKSAIQLVALQLEEDHPLN